MTSGIINAIVRSMKAFTTDELRGKASELRKVISRESEALLTEGGEPVVCLWPWTAGRSMKQPAPSVRRAPKWRSGRFVKELERVAAAESRMRRSTT